MKSDQPNPARAGELAQKIVGILTEEDEAMQRRAIDAAMMLLGQPSLARSSGGPPDGEANEPTLGKFFDRNEDLKPSDNAQLCAAYHYSMYGPAVFSLDDVKAISGEAGVVLPDRLDMTLLAATKNGKKLFQSAGRGSFKPTAAAALLFKERWGVKPGRKSKAP
jgi:hypothetical protein